MKEKKERKKKALVAKKDKPRRAGVLIPNENIKLLEKDPTFETRSVLIPRYVHVVSVRLREVMSLS